MNLRTRLAGLLFALLVCSGAHASTFNLFSPAAGILKGNPSTYVTSAATSTDVIATWSGTCNSTTFLRGDGQCTSTGTIPTGANPTATIGLTAVNGVATTYTRSDGAPALSQAITPTWTGTHTFNSSNSQIVLQNTSAAANAKNWLPRVSTSGDYALSTTSDAAPTTPVTNAFAFTRSGSALATMSFGNATDNPTYSFLGSGATSFAGNVTVGGFSVCRSDGTNCPASGGSFANPTGTIGLTAVNGVLTSGMRSDGAPALSQAIVPTWTGVHTFTGATTDFSRATPTLQLIDSGGAADAKRWQTYSSSGQYTLAAVNDAQSVARHVLDVSRTGVAISAITLGNVTDNPSLAVNGVSMTPAAGTFTLNLTGCTTAYTITAQYLKIGNWVWVQIPGNFTCTSNTTTFSATVGDVPAALRPPTNRFGLTSVGVDNSSPTNKMVNVFVSANGKLDFSNQTSGGGVNTGWTASGIKDVEGYTMWSLL